MFKYTINISILYAYYIVSISVQCARVNILYFIVNLLLEYEAILFNVTHSRRNDTPMMRVYIGILICTRIIRIPHAIRCVSKSVVYVTFTLY